jgi:hypothetical protein
MKQITDYIKESENDGKNGHYEDFADEDTGEIITLWVDDPTPEELEAREKEREESARKYYEKCEKERAAYKELKIDSLEDEVWNYQQELKDLHDQYRQLEIDQEEEVGGLYADGKEAEAEKLAQKYGKDFNKLASKQLLTQRKLAASKTKLSVARKKMDKIRNELWG